MDDASVPMAGQDVPLDDPLGLAGYMDAYSAAGGVELPSTWTPEHVQARVVEAFEVLARSGGQVGPRSPGSAWPAALREFADLIDEDARAEAERQWRAARAAPTSTDLSRMAEALQWPLLYLRHAPLQADALVLFGLGSGDDVNIREIIRTRKETARGRIAMLQQHGDLARKAIARNVAEWADRRLKKASHERAARVKANAAIRFERACRERGVLPRAIKPAEVMPGKILSRSNLDKQRKRATAAIADALNAAGIPVS